MMDPHLGVKHHCHRWIQLTTVQDIIQSAGQEAAGLVVPSRGRRTVRLSHVDRGQT